MRIITTKGEFDMPRFPDVRHTIYNLILSSAGEQTVPLTLPSSDNNLFLLDYPDRADNIYKPLQEIDVVVQSGLISRRANMVINDVDTSEGISVTIYLSAGDFYSRIQGVKLSSLNWPAVKSPTYEADTPLQRVTYLINLLKQELNAPGTSTQFRVVPVITGSEATYKVYRQKPDLSWEYKDITRNIELNGYEKYQHQLDFSGWGFDTLNTLEGEFTHTHVNNGVSIAIARGYGMTPFLKINYVLQHIFNYYGYTVDFVSFADQLGYDTFAPASLVNTVADAIYSGVLNYSQLVPSCDVSEFIAAIEDHYAVKFIPNEHARRMNIKRFSNESVKNPDADLSSYLSGKLKFYTPEFRQFHVKSQLLGTTPKSILPLEEIELQLSDITDVTAEYAAPAFSARNAMLLLRMAMVGNVVHRNSQIQGQDSENTEESSEIVIIESIEDSVAADFVIDAEIPVSVSYRRSYAFLHHLSQNDGYDIWEIDNQYWHYARFIRHSNILIEAPMNMPESVINQLDIYTPKILAGQKVMIESISKMMDDVKDGQLVKFRTLRTFIDR